MYKTKTNQIVRIQTDIRGKKYYYNNGNIVFINSKPKF